MPSDKETQILYSICMCNYNMGDTLQKSLESILKQIDSRFEVILVDDGSQDESIEIGFALSKKYKNFIFLPLERDSNRRLGETRNISIRKSSGEWCIFHLDTDDEIGDYISEFALAVTELSKHMPRDVLFSGQQIHMGKRNFLLNHGPFRNIYRGEDRDLYMRLVRTSEWIVIKHKRFITRYERSWKKLFIKNLQDNYDQVVNDLQRNFRPVIYMKESLSNRTFLGMRIVTFRLVILPIAIREARRRGIIFRHENPTHEEFLEYRKANTRSFSEWFALFNRTLPEQLNKDIFY